MKIELNAKYFAQNMKLCSQPKDRVGRRLFQSIAKQVRIELLPALNPLIQLQNPRHSPTNNLQQPLEVTVVTRTKVAGKFFDNFEI